jgi:hypothetical protein
LLWLIDAGRSRGSRFFPDAHAFSKRNSVVDVKRSPGRSTVLGEARAMRKPHKTPWAADVIATPPGT